jgi:hypothetical protein
MLKYRSKIILVSHTCVLHSGYCIVREVLTNWSRSSSEGRDKNKERLADNPTEIPSHTHRKRVFSIIVLRFEKG